MRGMKRASCAAGLALLLLVVTGASAQDRVDLTGMLQYIYGDVLPLGSGEPLERHFLLGDDGSTWDLRIDPAALTEAGGALALNRQRVVVSGRRSRTSESAVDVDRIALEREADRDNLDRFRTSGPQPYVWILLRFGDDPSTPEPRAWFEGQALGPHPSLDHFWRELSFDLINLTGSQVAGWYTLPRPRSYYVYDINPNDPGDEVDFGRCRVDAVALADPDVYFPDFIGVNLCFNGVLDGAAWGGGANITADGVTRWYGITYMPDVPNGGAGWRSHGVLAHEMGHALGLPHSSGPYGQTYDSQWDVMSSAMGTCAQSDPTYGCLGTHTIGYHKNWLGWIPEQRRYIVGTTPEVTTLTLSDLAVVPAAGYHHYVRIPGGADNFYTVERRRLTGYDQNIPGPAVVLHHVDYAVNDQAKVVDPDGNGNCNDDGAQWVPGETFYDSEHSVLVTVEMADDSRSLVTFTNAPRSTVYVDGAYSGYESGVSGNPWNTVLEGYGAATPAGTVYVKPGTYAAPVVMTKAVTLTRNGTSGMVTIGQ